MIQDMPNTCKQSRHHQNVETMKKIHLVIALFAVVITASAFAVQSAPQKSSASFSTYWVFTGTDISQVFDADHYEPNENPPSCESGTELPCKILSNATDRTELQVYLDSFNEDEESLMAVAIGKRD